MTARLIAVDGAVSGTDRLPAAARGGAGHPDLLVERAVEVLAHATQGTPSTEAMLGLYEEAVAVWLI